MRTANEIIEALGGFNAVADHLSLPYTTVHSWSRFDSIPEWRWPAVMDLCARKGLPVSASDRPQRPRAAQQAAA